MFFETLENDIKTKLSTDLGSGVEVELLPEKQAEYSKPFSLKRVSVCYKQSEFDKPKDTGIVVQDETQQIEMVIQARVLRGENGVYKLSNDVKNSLIGFAPTNCGKIYASKFLTEEYKEGVWYWTFTFACKTQIVEDLTESSTPLLTNPSATYINNGYN